MSRFKRVSRFILPPVLLGAIALNSCRDEERDDTDYPIWLLSVDAIENNEEGTPVRGCPQLLWRYSTDEGDARVRGCQENSNNVYTFEHIDSMVTVVYIVRCDGYFDSQSRVFTFRAEDAQPRPGHEGPVVAYYDRVPLQRIQ